MQSRGSRAVRAGRLGVAAVLVVVLSASAAESAWAAPADDGGVPPAEPGGFSVGDGVEGLIDPRDGALSFTLPVGGVEVSWDSRRLGSDRLGLGPGWAIPVTTIDTRGGVRVTPRSGRVHEASSADASGLLGYDGDDLRFETGDGEYALYELGGVRTAFDRDGNPVERVDATGRRTRWEWDDAVPHRLRRIVDVHGVTTELDWRSVRNAVIVRPGVNVPDAAGRMWRIERGRGGVLDAVVDPLGGRYEVGYRDGLVSSLTVPSGATTEVEWQSSTDGQPRASRVRTVNVDGVELSAREWSSSGNASGWPVVPMDAAGATVALGGGHETVLRDGASTVRSAYDGVGRLRSRSVRVTTGSGERTLQEQRLEYPGDGARLGAQLPAGWSRPSAVTVTHHGVLGAMRSVTERIVSDAAGQPVERTAPDGTVARIEYDQQVPAGARLPIGLPTLEIVTTPDGLVRETEHTLSAERTAVVATEIRSGAPGALTVTGRSEQVVRPDGFVTERRVFPGGDAQAASFVVTRTEHTDLNRGTSTVTETGPAPTGAQGADGAQGPDGTHVPDGPAAMATTSTTTSLLHGGVVVEADVLGRTASAYYDALGRPLDVVDAAGEATTISYETIQRHGRNATVTSLPGGVVATEVRDELGRPIRIADNIDRGVATPGFERVAETRSYPSPGVVRVTDAWGATTETTTDVLGRAVRVESPSGLVHLTEYDDVAGTVTTGATPTGRMADAELVTTTRRDEVDRVSTTSVTRADEVGTPDAVARADGFGRTVFTDDGTAATEVAYDPAGNPVRTATTPRGGEPLIVERRFDAFGTSLEKRIADGVWSATGGRRETDEAGRVVSEIDQRGGTRTTAHTLDGRPERTITGAGRVSSFRYDERTRQLEATTVTSPVGPAVSTEFEYDTRTGRPLAVFDPADPTGSRIEYAFDDFGNLLETRYPDGAVIAHEYDAHGRLRATTDSAGRTTVRSFDQAGRLIGVVLHDGEADAPVLARAAYRYDAFDRVDRVELGNGVVTTYTFTSASEIASERTTRDDEVLAEREYTYDHVGRLIERSDRVPAASGRAGPDASTTAYDYDGHGRLIRSTVRDDETGALRRSSEYVLGLAGDVAAVTERTADGARTRAFEYSPVGELVAVSTDGDRALQDYDAAGNLVRAEDGTTMAYDAADRVRTRTDVDGTLTAMTYWADGTRRERTTIVPGGAAVTATFHWDGDTLLDETHTTPEAVDAPAAHVSYLLGSARHARVVGVAGADAAASTRYLGTDGHGNVTELTDEIGALTARYEYTDYGVATEHRLDEASAHPSDAFRNPYRYAGEYTDRDGTQPLGRRVYDAATMRFTTEDPASSEFTRYGYADLNPITRSDPTGEAASDVVHWVVTALIVAVSVATTILDVATAGTALAVAGIVMLGVADVAATALDAANQHTRFMPENVAMTVGFVVAAASLLTMGMLGRGNLKRPRASSGARIEAPADRHADVQPFDVAGVMEIDEGLRPSANLPWIDDDAVARVDARLAEMATERQALDEEIAVHVSVADSLLSQRVPWDGDAYDAWVARWPQLASNGRDTAARIFSHARDARRMLLSWSVAERELLVRRRLPAEIVAAIRGHALGTGTGILEDAAPWATELLAGRLRPKHVSLELRHRILFSNSAEDWTWGLRDQIEAIEAFPPVRPSLLLQYRY
jgi:RHS repeat-associated protein